MDIKKITCKCSHEGSATYREKDNAYSSYGIWRFEGFNCKKNPVEKPISMTWLEAIEQAEPQCPRCNSMIE